MPQIRLISWDPEKAREHARALKKAGFTVDASPLNASRLVSKFRDNPPRVVLIDLERLPSHGRAVAVMLRSAKSTGHLPIVFAGGAEDKVQRAREQVPGAFFCDWDRAAGTLKKALKQPAQRPAQKSYMEHYAGSSLDKKLGVKPNLRVALVAAPDGFEEQLGELSDGVEFETKITARTQMAIWFVRSLRELAEETDYMSVRLPLGASIWIAYPKKTSRIKVDFNQNDVRAIGLAAGLVDYKICAIDSDWTGLKFSRKRK